MSDFDVPAGPAPTSAAAEWAVLAAMLTTPTLIGEVIGVPLEAKDFSQPDTRVLWQTTVSRYYANQPVDALIVGEVIREELASYWSADPQSVAQLLVRRARDAMVSGSVLEHAGIVKRLSTSRQLMESCHHALREITEGKLTPEEIGDNLSSDALQITSGTIKRTELLDWLDTGRAYVSHLQRVMAAREAGQEVGVYTGLSFIDRYTSGIGPGELCFLAGEPGSGKSAVAWTVGPGFAARSLARPCAVGQRPVGTLMLSLEMPLISSTMRMVQSLTGIDGTRLREGKITKSEYRQILTEWKNRENLPIFWNFASNFRLSQMRALIAEAIRRANVGFVIIDHFRMVDTDRVYQNANQEDEAKVRFLKENIAMDLDVAVMCLAHTVKVGRGQGEESPKPRLSDLRGSGQIAAHADMVGFVWSPTKYMSDEAKTELDVDPEDMNISWEKSRFGAPATTGFKFNAQKMSVRDA